MMFKWCKQYLMAFSALGFLSAFILLQGAQKQASDNWKPLPSPPADTSLFSFNFAEPQLLARSLMLWLQTYDSQSGKLIQYDQLSYEDIIKWLTLVHKLNKRSQYPMITATHLFTETRDQSKVRQMLGFVEQSFLSNPEAFWRWQAYAIVLAKHRLKDIDYALQLAQNLNKATKNHQIDAWARDMEFLILEDIGEFEASALLIKNLLDSGEIKEARELRFLTSKLKAIKDKQAAQ